MEKVSESEFQQLSARQKEGLIRKKLAEFDTDTSDRGWKQLNVSFLHPEVLTWEGVYRPVRLPPQQGKIIDLSPDIAFGRRKRLKFIRVDLTGTTLVTGISYAQFGLGAVEIAKGGEIVIDCTKLDSPKGLAQAMFPQNTFVEKVAAR